MISKKLKKNHYIYELHEGEKVIPIKGQQLTLTMFDEKADTKNLDFSKLSEQMLVALGIIPPPITCSRCGKYIGNLAEKFYVEAMPVCKECYKKSFIELGVDYD